MNEHDFFKALENGTHVHVYDEKTGWARYEFQLEKGEATGVSLRRYLPLVLKVVLCLAAFWASYLTTDWYLERVNYHPQLTVQVPASPENNDAADN